MEPNPGRKILFAYESGMQSLVDAKSSSRGFKKEPKNEFEILHLCEFTSDQIKAESTQYEKDKSVLIMPICMAYHGGPLGNA